MVRRTHPRATLTVVAVAVAAVLVLALCGTAIASSSSSSATGRRPLVAGTKDDENTAKIIQNIKDAIPRLNMRGESVSKQFALDEDYYESLAVIALPGLLISGIAMAVGVLFCFLRFCCFCEPFNNCGGITMNKQGGYSGLSCLYPFLGIAVATVFVTGAVTLGSIGDVRTHSAQDTFSLEIIATGKGLAASISSMNANIGLLTAADDSTKDYKAGYSVGGSYDNALSGQVKAANGFVSLAETGREWLTRMDNARYYFIIASYAAIMLLLACGLLGAVLRFGLPSFCLGMSAFVIFSWCCVMFSIHMSLSVGAADFCRDVDKMVGTTAQQTGNPDVDRFLKCLDKTQFEEVHTNVDSGFNSAYSDLNTEVTNNFSGCSIQKTDKTAADFWSNVKKNCAEYATLVSCCASSTCTTASDCDNKMKPTDRVYKSVTMFQDILDGLIAQEDCTYVRAAYTTIDNEVCVEAVLGIDFMILSFLVIALAMVPASVCGVLGYKRFQRVKTRDANDKKDPFAQDGQSYELEQRYPAKFPTRPLSTRPAEGG